MRIYKVGVICGYKLDKVREMGLTVLAENLDPISYALFVQQCNWDMGDYTKEKYEQPELSDDEILEGIKRFDDICKQAYDAV